MSRARWGLALALIGWTFVLFPIGARVTVINGCVNVRALPSLTSPVIGTQCTGALGSVVASEVPGPGGSDTTTRANINYDTGVDGWSWVYYLKLVSPPPANKPPIANFSVSCTGLTCTFTSTSTDSDGTIAGARWSFGDLGTAATPVATHTFLSGGTFPVALTVTDNAGASTTLTQLVTVVAPPPPPPPSGLPNVLQVVPATLHPMSGLVYSGTAGAVYCRTVEHPFYAILRDSTGAAQVVNATWASSDTTVATIGSATGNGQFRAPGTAVLTATVGAWTAQATVTVTAQPVTQVSIFLPFGIGTQQWWTGLHEREAFDSLGQHTAHLVVCVLAP